MAKIINFNETPVTKIKRQLIERDRAVLELKNQLRMSHQKLGMLVSVNEMLKLQLQDALTNLNFLQHHLNSFGHNLSSLKQKLPDLSDYSQPVTVKKLPDSDNEDNVIDLNLEQNTNSDIDDE